MTVIDGATDRVLATLRTGVFPWAICYDAEDDKVYCANAGNVNVSVIDGALDSVVATVCTDTEPKALCYVPQVQQGLLRRLLQRPRKCD